MFRDIDPCGDYRGRSTSGKGGSTMTEIRQADFLSPTILYAKPPAMTGSLLLFGGDGTGKARF